MTIDAAELDASSEPVCAPVPSGIVAWWEGEALGVDREESFPSSSQQSNPSVVAGLVDNAIQYGSDDFLQFDPAPTPTTFSIETVDLSNRRTV